MNIEEYRYEFMCIEKYEWITMFLCDRHASFSSLIRNPNQRSYTYGLLTVEINRKDEKSKEETPKPKVKGQPKMFLF